MKTKRTLDKTWDLCLQMWLDISQKWAAGSSFGIYTLKRNWLNENGFEDEIIYGNCFFCDYPIIMNDSIVSRCKYCPGILIDSDFSCDNDDYAYDENPVAFYEELLRLNKIRKGENEKTT